MKTRCLGLFVFCRITLFVAALAVLPAHADSGRYSGGTWAPIDAKKTLQAAMEITLAKYPDCDEATVEQKVVEAYRADGTAESQEETYVKVLTEKGKRNHRTL